MIHDGSEEVVSLFPDAGSWSGTPQGRDGMVKKAGTFWGDKTTTPSGVYDNTRGSAARFFYCAKASRRERGEGNTHPTVKPQALLRYLVTLITPPGGVVLDPFAGSGSTLLAAQALGFSAIGIELDEQHCEIAAKRLEAEVLPLELGA